MKNLLIDTAKKYFEDKGLKFGVKQRYRDVPELFKNFKEEYQDKYFIPTSVEFKSFGHEPAVVLKGKEFKKNGEEKMYENIIKEYSLKD